MLSTLGVLTLQLALAPGGAAAAATPAPPPPCAPKQACTAKQSHDWHCSVCKEGATGPTDCMGSCVAGYSFRKEFGDCTGECVKGDPPHGGVKPVAVDTGSSDWRMGYDHTESEAGISWYTHMWQMFPGGVPANWGIGMPGTWLHGTGISFAKACACNPNGWPNNPKVAPGDQANHCCDKGPNSGPDSGKCSFLYETIEGGPQDDERWRTGANVGCFAYTAGAGLFNYDDHSPANQHPCEEIAFAAVSNQMLLQPNGASFVKDGMLGVGYVRTPLGKTSAADKRSFWTLVFDTETFSGPLGYYLPEFFASRDKSADVGGAHPDPAWWKKSTELKDMGSPGIGLNNDQVAMEWNHGVTYQQNNSDGKLFIKLPNISFPFTSDGELILAMGNQIHTDAAVSVPLEAALKWEAGRQHNHGQCQGC